MFYDIKKYTLQPEGIKFEMMIFIFELIIKFKKEMQSNTRRKTNCYSFNRTIINE